MVDTGTMYPVSNIAAGFEPGEPAGDGPANSVWFTYTVPEPGGSVTASDGHLLLACLVHLRKLSKTRTVSVCGLGMGWGGHLWGRQVNSSVDPPAGADTGSHDTIMLGGNTWSILMHAYCTHSCAPAVYRTRQSCELCFLWFVFRLTLLSPPLSPPHWQGILGFAYPNPSLDVFTGDNVTSLSKVIGSAWCPTRIAGGFQACATFNGTAGTKYYLRMDGPADAVGEGTLQVRPCCCSCSCSCSCVAVAVAAVLCCVELSCFAKVALCRVVGYG